MIRGFLFDLDGVLVDTAQYHFLAWQRMAAELGIHFGEAENEQLKGVSRAESLNRILAWGGKSLSDAEKQHWMTLKNDWYLELVRGMPADDYLPGAHEFLRASRAAGIKVALGSASKNAPLILERLGWIPLFDAMVDGNVVTASKPDPEVFLEGARRLGLKPEECVVFEDSEAGVEAARRGGMKVVGIGHGLDADLLVSGLDQLTPEQALQL
ncbi:MAG: beta-phosphoglucomutase [Schleiferiaceae bacterium]|nr:beta-phosphoglucomutase [Schleiferiaceae bacterium]MDP4833904.1 beta-phosphoglucomutase [Schleiferiaceae bacterium]